MQPSPEFLEDLIDVARPLIREVLAPDSCIGSTRIGLDVLAYFGIKAIPLPVSLVILNAEAAQILIETESMEELAKAVAIPTAQQEGGPWTIGVGAPGQSRGTPAEPGKWPGHLVIGIPAHHLVVDLSLDQVSRPHKGLDMHCCWYSTEPRWWQDRAALTQCAIPEGALMLVHHLDDEDYRKSPNWKRRSSSEPGEVLRAVSAQVISGLRARGWRP